MNVNAKRREMVNRATVSIMFHLVNMLGLQVIGVKRGPGRGLRSEHAGRNRIGRGQDVELQRAGYLREQDPDSARRQSLLQKSRVLVDATAPAIEGSVGVEEADAAGGGCNNGQDCGREDFVGCCGGASPTSTTTPTTSGTLSATTGAHTSPRTTVAAITSTTTPSPLLEVRGTRCEGDWSDGWQPCERQGDNRGRQYRTWRIKDVGSDYSCHDAFIAKGGKEDANHEYYLCGTGFHDTAKCTYLGCYRDGTSSTRAMKFGDDFTFDNVEKCARFCGGMMNVPGSNVYNGGKNATDAPYVYFALQVGIQCFCSNDKQKTLGQGEMLLPTEQFDNPLKTRKKCAVCPDNQDKGLSCGSNWSNSVYETPYPDNRQYCPGGQTPRRIVQWRNCPRTTTTNTNTTPT